MADVVDVGLLPDDGNGDKLRTGGQKINAKFVLVDAAVALNTAKVTNTTHTGDATGSGALTLATVNASPGTFYNPAITVNGKGLVTAAATTAHTGDVTGSTALTLATVNSDVGTFTNASITVNAKGLVTAVSSGTGSTIQSATLTANATTNIVIGDTDTDRAIFIKYGLVRGTIFQAGQIVVLSRGATVDEPSWVIDIGDDAGLTMTADISGDDIRLNMTVDNSVVTNITFDYTLTVITASIPL
jgi:hypothetical protein